MARRRRILIAVNPPILADVLADVLSHNGDEVEVIDLRDPPSAHPPADIAVITEDPGGIETDLLIELPDHEGGAGRGRITSRDGSRLVDLTGIDDLLRVLEI